MSLFKKFFTIATVAIIAVAVAAPVGTAQAALSQSQIDSILGLLDSFGVDSATRNSVQSALTGQPTTGTPSTGGSISGIPSGFSFNTNLSAGSTGNDVIYLQILLNSNSATQLASSGVGSSGNESTFYGPLTASGVSKFQELYASSVLTPSGLSSGTGYFGPSSRAKANSLLGSVVTPPPTGGVTTTPPPVGGNTLGVSLASDQPGDGNIAKSSNTNFTKVTFTAGSSDVTVSKAFVARTGLSANSDWENVKFIDMNGIRVGSVGSFNVNNKSTITFVPALSVPAGTSKSF